MKFKVGDVVRITLDDIDYSNYKGREGVISYIDEGEEYPYTVEFYHNEDDEDERYFSVYVEDELGFLESELELV